jgi:hypothetical protein
MNQWQDVAVWQVAGGSLSRNYADDFVKHDVVGVGGAKSEPSVRFFGRIHDGDVVVLRDGGSRTRIRAIGVVAGDYPPEAGPYFLAQGWPLEYVRRVRWLLEDAREFDGGMLPRRRVSRLGQAAQSAIISSLRRGALDLDRRLRDLPTPVTPIDLDSTALPESVQSIRLLAERFTGLGFQERVRFGPLPRENEATSHFVVPLLVALGWPYQLIAVEWHRIDIAVFSRLPRAPENCRLIIEVKHVGTGPTGADDQSTRYKKRLGLPEDVARYASDGFRFWAFRDEDRTLELDLTHPTLEGLRVLDSLRPPHEVVTP